MIETSSITYLAFTIQRRTCLERYGRRLAPLRNPVTQAHLHILVITVRINGRRLRSNFITRVGLIGRLVCCLKKKVEFLICNRWYVFAKLCAVCCFLKHVASD